MFNGTFKTSINFQVQCFFLAFNFLFFPLNCFLLTLFSLNLLVHLLVLVILTLLHYAMLLLHLLMHIIILLILTLVITQATIINGSIPNSSISFLKIWCLLVLMGLVHGCYHSNLVSICSINDKCSLHSGLKSFNYPNPFVLLIILVTLRQLNNHFTNIFPTFQKNIWKWLNLGGSWK